MKKKTREERAQNRALWYQAMWKMPGKKYFYKDIDWVSADGMKIADFIAARAKGLVEETRPGHFLVKKITLVPQVLSGMGLLLVMMGEIGQRYGKRHVTTSITRGTLPKHPKARARLKKLAKNGNKIAWAYLRECGKDHLYANQQEVQNVKSSED